MRQWTPEERQKQAEAIRRWKPWTKSTGPKTEEGKARCKYNADKGGIYGADYASARQVFLLHVQFMKPF